MVFLPASFLPICMPHVRTQNAGSLAVRFQSSLPACVPAWMRAVCGELSWVVCIIGCCAVLCCAVLVYAQVRPGLMREQRSVVHIKKCRYLENSGCVGMCMNMCKVGADRHSHMLQFGCLRKQAAAMVTPCLGCCKAS
jgi:hypothetical protein